MFGMDHPWGKEIQICSNKDQVKSLGHVWPHPRGLNFYIVIYRKMLKKCFSEEPLLGMH